ncbi:MAG: serine hydrolase [Acidimicrobiales bacterium]
MDHTGTYPKLLPLPPQPPDVEWPESQWPLGGVEPCFDPDRVELLTTGAIEDQPPELGIGLATLIVHRGRLVAEAYGSDTNADTTLISWSMAKSMLQVVIGMLVCDGLLDPDTPAPVGEWTDVRSEITIRQLLQMRPGLIWNEDYIDGQVSNVIEMLFGDGKDDMGSYAAALLLEDKPGAVWKYSSGVSNILSRIVRDTLGGGSAYEAYLQDRLFGPLHMSTATARFDEVGTFVGSSFVYASARDFARFGLFALRDGVWNGERLLPEGWIDCARTMHARDEDLEGYGEHWWLLDDRYGSFFCSGYEGQRIVCVPALDLVVVRLGKTPADLGLAWRDQLADIIACFDPSI